MDHRALKDKTIKNWSLILVVEEFINEMVHGHYEVLVTLFRLNNALKLIFIYLEGKAELQAVSKVMNWVKG